MDSHLTRRLPLFVPPSGPSTENDGVEGPVSALADTPDEALMERLRSGSTEALGQLFERHRHVIRGIANRILRDASEAEDLVQDLFIFLQRKCEIFDQSKSYARSWIVQMTYHRAIERRRYLTARGFYCWERPAGDQAVGIPTNEVDYCAEAVFGRNGLEKLFKSLSEDQRETLRLHFFFGMSLPEAARQLGQTHGNIRNHYYRALDKLRKQIFRNSVRVVEADGKHEGQAS